MFEEARTFYTSQQWEKLRRARVGIAGAGGLGSNAAMMLARSGVGALVLIDGDRVEARNLIRQHYFPRHIGMLKVEALAEQILELVPDMELDIRPEWLEEENMDRIIGAAPIWIEALDRAETKARFASAALKAGKNVVSGIGMAGVGGTLMRRRTSRAGTACLAAVGDFCTDISQAPPLAPRVTQCAAMEADAVLEWILNGTIGPLA